MFLEIALFVLLLIVYAVIRDRKPPNMPPGPFEIPFLGGIPFLDEKKGTELQKKFGDIVTYRVGNFRSVFLFDYYTAKDAMARIELSGRPEFFTDFSLDEMKLGGLVGSNGAQWQHDRRFALRNLRNLGMGKSYLEEAINIEAQALVDDLKKYNENPLVFPDSFRTAALNIIWQMVASKRFDLRSKEVDEIYQMTKEFQNSTIVQFLPTFFPVLKHLPLFLKEFLFKESKLENFIAKMRQTVTTSVDFHIDGHRDNANDLISEYLTEMEEEKESDALTKFCRKGALLQIISDLFQAGSDTVNFSLKWSCYLMAQYPEVTKNVQQQIDEVVGRDRLVSLEDKPNLPLVEAFTLEVLRYSSMIVQNVQRIALQDIEIGGYFIPKGTLVVASNYHINMDERFWKDPQIFDPERHLDENGRCKQPKKGFFPFGSGRRQCVGESLARMELFLFTAAILQHFNVRVPPGSTLPQEYDNKLGIRAPKEVPLIYEIRT